MRVDVSQIHWRMIAFLLVHTCMIDSCHVHVGFISANIVNKEKRI